MNLLTEQLIAEAKNFDEFLAWKQGIKENTGIELGEVLITRDMLTNKDVVSFPQYSSLETADRNGYLALDTVARKLYSDKAQNGCFVRLAEDDNERETGEEDKEIQQEALA